jgi:hypothetical protein
MVALAVLHLLAGLFFAAGGVALTAGTDVRFPFLAATLFASAAVGVTLAGTLLAHPNAPRMLVIVLVTIQLISMTMAFFAANEVVAWERELDSWGLAELAARMIQIVQAITGIVCLVTLVPPAEPLAENSSAGAS